MDDFFTEFPAWKKSAEKLVREYSFSDFKAALDFVNTIGEIAETANHHPNITLTWGKVCVELWSHDVGEITERDYDVAAKIEHAFHA